MFKKPINSNNKYTYKIQIWKWICTYGFRESKSPHYGWRWSTHNRR